MLLRVVKRIDRSCDVFDNTKREDGMSEISLNSWGG
jgi:hypothetical protein